MSYSSFLPVLSSTFCGGAEALGYLVAPGSERECERCVRPAVVVWADGRSLAGECAECLAVLLAEEPGSQLVTELV